MMRGDRLRVVILGIAAVAILSILAGLAGISGLALRSFERSLLPEMERKAETVARAVGSQIERADQFGIALLQLRGVDAYFDAVLEANPEITYLTIVGGDGQVLFHSGASSPPLAVEGQLPAEGEIAIRREREAHDTLMHVGGSGGEGAVLHVGLDQAFVQQALQEILLDIVTVLVISLLVAFELLRFVLTLRVTSPIRSIREAMERVRGGDLRLPPRPRASDRLGHVIDLLYEAVERVNRACESTALRYQEMVERADLAGRDGLAEARRKVEQVRARYRLGGGDGPGASQADRLATIRLPLFLFFFAEEMSRAFLPIYVARLQEAVPVPFLSSEVVVGLPISIFMLIMALSQPFGGTWSDRVGRRRAFMVGALLSTVGLAMTAFAQSLYDLILWRSLCALGYGLVFLTCQGYIADNTSAAERARGMALFVGGVMTASICGPAIGAIVADRIGYGPTFLLSAGLAAVSLIVVRQFLIGGEPSGAVARRRLRLSDFGAVLSSRRFLILLLCAAVPAKLVLTGFLYYLVPLYLIDLGASQSTVGRVIMIYGVSMVVLGPAAALLADRFKMKAGFVALGGLLSGGGLFVVLLGESTWIVVAAVLALGLAHAMSVSTQLALVPDLFPEGSARIGRTTVLGVFRLIERLGSAAGPFVTALLLARFDYDGAMVVLGALTLAAAVIFAVTTFLRGSAPRPAETPA